MKTNRFLLLILSCLFALALARDLFAANTTIKDIATTSVLPAVNDYTVQDGATYGTRKLAGIGYTYLTANRTTLAALSITGAADGVGILVLGATTAGDGGGATYFWSAASTATPNGNTVILPASAPGTGRWLKATGNIGFPGPSTIGGVFSNAGTAHQWVSSINTDGTVTLTQPGISDVTGLGSIASQSSAAVSITGGTISGVTATFPNTGLKILDTDASHVLTIQPSSDLTANRALAIATGDASRTVTLNGNPTLNDWFDQSVKTVGTPIFVSVLLSSTGTTTNFRIQNATTSVDGLMGSLFNSSILGVGTVSAHDVGIYRNNTQVGLFTAAGFNGAVGATTPAAGAFTTLSATTPLAGASGGTGVANTGKTLTLGGNFTTSGAFASTFTMTGTTGVTLPTTGTLATLLGVEAMANKTMTASAFNGTLGATTPSTASVTNLTVNLITRTGTSTNNAILGVVSDSTSYNLLTLNNVATMAGSLGVSGGGGSDNSLYLRAPTGGTFDFLVNNSLAGRLTSTGINATPIGATTPAAATFTTISSGAASIGNSNLRTSKANYNVALNVKDFGAVCDGTTNDTAAVAAAVAALPASNASLYFPGLCASDTVAITGKTGLTIYADGNGSGGLKSRTGGVVLTVASSSTVTIRNMTFDGNCTVRTPGATAVTLDVASNLIFSNNTIKNSGQYNVLIGPGATQNVDVNVTNNVLLGGYADGINLQNVARFVVANNTIDGVDDDCIALGYNGSGFTTQGVVIGNFCRARNDLGTNTGRGIWVGKATDILIADNNVDTIKQTGIWISDDGTGTRPARISVKNNKVRNVATSSGHGISVYKADYVTLEGNTVENPASGNCIEIADWNRLSIIGGTLTQTVNTFCRGIHVDESGGWSSTWTDLVISDVNIRMVGASTDLCVYLAPASGVTMNNGAVTNVKGYQVNGGSYIYVDTAKTGTLWKIGNNVAVGPASGVLPASSTGVVTVFNNN